MSFTKPNALQQILFISNISANSKLCFLTLDLFSFSDGQGIIHISQLSSLMSLNEMETLKCLKELKDSSLVVINSEETDAIVEFYLPYKQAGGIPRNKRVYIPNPIKKSPIDISWMLSALPGNALKVFIAKETIESLTDNPQIMEILREENGIRDLISANIHMGLKEVAYWLEWLEHEVYLTVSDILIDSAIAGIPDATERLGYVYVVKSDRGFYKIGRTINPENRRRTFEVKLPFEVEYLALIKAFDMVELEKLLHRRFSKKRVNGEWFMLDEDDIVFLRKLEQDGKTF